jgi:hypothetical protein
VYNNHFFHQQNNAKKNSTFYKHDFKQLAKIEKHPRTRIRFIGLSHIQNGKSYEQVAQYLLQSLSAVIKNIGASRSI